MENLFAGLENNVEKMFEKKNLPIDPLPQMSWVHDFVRQLRHSQCVFKVTTKLCRPFPQIWVWVVVSVGKSRQLYDRHVVIR